MDRWSLQPFSMQARVSIVKMDVLPRVNFFSSMLPLSPPKGYWDKIHGLVTNFIWKGKRPRLKLTTLQRGRENGGLAVPNFKFYFWAYVLRPLSIWLDPNISVSWRAIEENLASPHRLQDLVRSSLSSKHAKAKLGPILSSLLSVWLLVEKATHSYLKWHTHSPVFYNFALLTGKVPFSYHEWRSKGIHVLSDICNNEGLRSFTDLWATYNLPGFSFFSLLTTSVFHAHVWCSLGATFGRT